MTHEAIVMMSLCGACRALVMDEHVEDRDILGEEQRDRKSVV